MHVRHRNIFYLIQYRVVMKARCYNDNILGTPSRSANGTPSISEESFVKGKPSISEITSSSSSSSSRRSSLLMSNMFRLRF